LTEEAAEVLRGWMSKGLQFANLFLQTKPPSWFEAGSAAQQFVGYVARYTYSLKDRMSRLQKAGTMERFRGQRDAEGWKRKFQERREEIDESKRREVERQLEDELQLAETYAAIQERQLHIAQPNPFYPGIGDMTDLDFPLEDDPATEKRDRNDGVADNLDELAMTATLAVGGMFVDDPNDA
jgi:hypothetical protein